MMSIGFTGTRLGMTPDQQRGLRLLLSSLQRYHFHHGDCEGADAEAHQIALEDFDGSRDCRVVIHPPDDPKHQAGCEIDGQGERRDPAPYLVRNRQIVDESDLLLAAPHYSNERQRSGTWSTVRYARKIGVPVLILHQ